MQRQSQRRADPGKLLRRFVRERVRMMRVFVNLVVLMVMRVAIFGITLGRVVMVKVEETLQKKHRQESAQYPRRRPVNGMQLLRRIRQKMQQRDAQHQTGHKARRQLQARVRGTDDQQHPAARERREQNQDTVNGEQPDG